MSMVLDEKMGDGYSRTPLSWSRLRDHKPVVKLLLNTYNIEVDTKDENGRTVLSWAATQGSEYVKMLLDTGKVDIDTKDMNGRTPLLWAVAKRRDSVVKLLLDTGEVDIEAKDNKGRTPLTWAAIMGSKYVKMLLDTGKVN